MGIFLMGLGLFLGVHSVHMLAPEWRARTLASMGEQRWKGLYSLLSLLGLVGIVWGYSMVRQDPTVLWAPPAGLRHVTLTLMLFSWVLLLAAYVPGNLFKAKLHHPMLLGVLLWSLAHLAFNGRLVQVLLFGTFGVWAAFSLASCFQRDRLAGKTYPAGRWLPSLGVLLLAALVYGLFVARLHFWLFAVSPLP